jgi:hypothetical protein
MIEISNIAPMAGQVVFKFTKVDCLKFKFVYCIQSSLDSQESGVRVVIQRLSMPRSRLMSGILVPGPTT